MDVRGTQSPTRCGEQQAGRELETGQQRAHRMSPGARCLLSTRRMRGVPSAACGWVSAPHKPDSRLLRQTRSRPDLPQSGLTPPLAAADLPPPIIVGPTAPESPPHGVPGQGSPPLAALTVAVAVAVLLTLSLTALSRPSACGCSVWLRGGPECQLCK